MTKQEFMKELESLLFDISSEEREEALKYYNGYFEDAGEDQENAVIAELGSPKQVADIIKAELNANAAEQDNRGFYTEKGYQDTITNEFEISGINRQESNQSKAGSQSQSDKNSNRQTQQQTTSTKNTNIGLIILLCIIAIPVGLPLLFSVFGIAVGIIASLLGIIVGIGVSGIVMVCAGVVLLVVGVLQMSIPLVGLAICGIGLVILGLGMLLSLACGALCTKVLPALIRGIVNLCRMPFQNRSVMA